MKSLLLFQNFEFSWIFQQDIVSGRRLCHGTEQDRNGGERARFLNNNASMVTGAHSDWGWSGKVSGRDTGVTPKERRCRSLGAQDAAISRLMREEALGRQTSLHSHRPAQGQLRDSTGTASWGWGGGLPDTQCLHGAKIQGGSGTC